MFVYAAPLSAIVNIEKINSLSESKPFQGQLEFDLSGVSGNSEIRSGSLGSRLQWNDIATQFLVLKYDYAKSLGVKSTDKSFMHYRFVNNAKARSSWESFFQLEKNEFADLQLRSLLGAGMWFQLLEKNKNSYAKLGLGIFHSREELKPPAGAVTYDNINRANIYFTYKYSVTKGVNFLSTTYYQPDIESAADYRALEQLSFEFSVVSDLVYFITMDVSYDNKPFNSLEKNDSSYKSGIRYSF
ncbi:MAG: DUF481 domain-containing protein [Gammaproteobacteria bacterium]|nr:DUF481 domain-containing protein [Gammaproteobacteria bacterium]